MNLVSAFKKVVFENYANFKGRAKRAEYWWYALDSVIIGVILAGINEWAVSTGGFLLILLSSIVYYGVLLALFVPGLAVTWRRLHDMGKGGQWYWLCLIPIIGTIWLLVLLCQPSEPQENRFGPAEEE
jgi:uncharacterized membrane protein YhaH (DUF805 family)